MLSGYTWTQKPATVNRDTTSCWHCNTCGKLDSSCFLHAAARLSCHWTPTYMVGCGYQDTCFRLARSACQGSMNSGVSGGGCSSSVMKVNCSGGDTYPRASRRCRTCAAHPTHRLHSFQLVKHAGPSHACIMYIPRVSQTICITAPVPCSAVLSTCNIGVQPFLPCPPVNPSC